MKRLTLHHAATPQEAPLIHPTLWHWTFSLRGFLLSHNTPLGEAVLWASLALCALTGKSCK